MWEFFDRLVTLAIPRIRDFRGLNPRSFDGRGNYTFGLSEQLMFPEIDYDTVDQPRGMDITIVTTATNDAGGKALLDAFDFPFRREGQAQSWPRKHSSTSSSANPSSRSGPTADAAGAGARAPSTAASICAACASARWRTPARSPV
jgi:hypothetical protein